MNLVKVSKSKTNYKIIVYNKISKHNEIRYYDCMYDLFRAYRQLVSISSNLVFLYYEYV